MGVRPARVVSTRRERRHIPHARRRAVPDSKTPTARRNTREAHSGGGACGPHWRRNAIGLTKWVQLRRVVAASPAADARGASHALGARVRIAGRSLACMSRVTAAWVGRGRLHDARCMPHPSSATARSALSSETVASGFVTLSCNGNVQPCRPATTRHSAAQRRRAQRRDGMHEDISAARRCENALTHKDRAGDG